MRAFESQDRSFRELVFYSEGSGDWPHIGPVIKTLLRDHKQKVSYLTSDPADPGLGIDDPRFRSFQIGSGTVRTILFARIDAGRFVMTLPDLGSLWLKRSVHPVKYVYLFHSINSSHTAYRKGAFDAFDTILCVGPHHVDEIRRTEAVYGLRSKELVEHGSAKLDTVMAEFVDLSAKAGPDSTPQVLIAPSWGESSLIEHPIGRQLVQTVLRAGHQTVLRLHPMTMRRLPGLVSELRQALRDEPLFRLEEDMNATESWLRSDLMISDWSGAATEYAFALLKPVIYVDMPPKLLNPEWERIGTPAFEDTVRRAIGSVVDPSELATIPDVIDRTLRQGLEVRERIVAARSRSIFNRGRSSEVAAAYLAGSAA